MSQRYPMLVSKGNATPSVSPRQSPSTTFSGSKPAEPNNRLKSNPSSSQDKPPAYSEPPKLNHAFSGAKPNATSSLRQAPNPVQSKPEAPLQVKPPVLNNHVDECLDLTSRVAELITTFSEFGKSELREEAKKMTKILIKKAKNLSSHEQKSSENQKVAVVKKVKPKLVEQQLVRPPYDTQWDLFLMKFVDLAKVAVRLIGPEYSDKYALMENRMKERYIKNFKTAPKVVPSELLENSTYACIDVKTNFVSRVFIQRYLKNTNEVSVVFFDLGEEAIVSADNIYELEEEFFSLPAQSFEVKLEGLEPYKFNEFIADDFCVDLMCSKSYVATVSDKENLSVNLYDTSREVWIDVNKDLQKKVACKIQSLYHEYKTLKEKECFEAFVTNIDDMGNIFLNINNKAYKCLLERLSDIDRTKSLKTLTVNSIKDMELSRRYYFVLGESPLRAVLNKIISDETVLMEFVDCGHFRKIPIKSLFWVPDFNKVLLDIPHQATMVRLAGVDSWTSRHQSRFIEIVELFSKARIKVIYVRNDLPFVNISMYKNGQLVNVSEVMNSMGFQRNESVLKKKLDIDGQFKYKQMVVPTEKYIEVLVPFCDNAENISIQLVDYIQELRVLNNKIKLFYAENKPTRPSKEWRVGDACVISNKSNFFRGVILQFESDKFAQVHCVDFGHFLIVPIGHVFILNENFKDTPALAVNAKLAGIKPICGIKRAEAANLLNSYLREQKKFCARVVSIDDSYPVSSYSILLYDTTSEDDINFSELLVESGLALKAASD